MHVIRKRDQHSNGEQRHFHESNTTSHVCDKCDRNHNQGNCPAYEKKCFRCGKYNHFAFVCRFKSINNINVNKTVCVGESDSDESYIGLVEVVSDDSDGCVGSIDRVRRGCMSWYENIKIENSLITFKLDSGADVNILPLVNIKHINCENRMRPVTTKLEAYGGS